MAVDIVRAWDESFLGRLEENKEEEEEKEEEEVRC